MPRLDVWLVENGHFSSRQIAKRAIKEGMVSVNGIKCKPSKQVNGTEDIQVSSRYVNKPIGYHKLKKIDSHYNGNLVSSPCFALDIGSSAGGFLAYLCEKGATTIGIEVAKRFAKDLIQLVDSYSNLTIMFDDAFSIDSTIIAPLGTLDLLLIDVTTDTDGTVKLIRRFSGLLKKGGRLVAAFKTDDSEIVLQLIESVIKLGFEDTQTIYLDDTRQEVHIIACHK